MKILTVEEENISKECKKFNKYDLVLVRGCLYDESSNRKLHTIITSESPVLGFAKTIDNYLKEIMNLTLDTYKLKLKNLNGEVRMLETGFNDDKSGDIYRTYNNENYVIQIENCLMGRLYVRAFLFMALGKKIDISSGIEFLPKKFVKYSSYVKDVLAKGPSLVGIDGNKRVINSLTKYLENSNLEKIISFYEYQFTEEEKELIEKLDKPDKSEFNFNYERNRSFLTSPLIEKELGWINESDAQKIREAIVLDLKDNLKKGKKDPGSCCGCR